MSPHIRRGLRVALSLGLLLSGACSSFTSISRDAAGTYTLTGLQSPLAGGHFLWVCRYDPSSYTLTVIEEHRQ